MATGDPVEVLLAHNAWATRQLLEACTKLSPSQFHQRFEIGPGSLHDTMIHIVGAMRGLGDTLNGREPRPRLEASGAQLSATDLLAMLD